MSGIKYEMLTGDDLISALRGGRTGDLLDDAAYAAADEIERLRGLLQRHYELRGKPAREEWVDGGPTYRLAMQLWRDTAAALAGAADQPSAALTRDAARYRWLRVRASQSVAYDRYGDGCHWSIGFFSEDSRKGFDAAVDENIPTDPTLPIP